MFYTQIFIFCKLSMNEKIFFLRFFSTVSAVKLPTVPS